MVAAMYNSFDVANLLIENGAELDAADSEGKTPIIVGGTGMYISKLIDGISQIPEVSQETRNKIVNLYNEIGYNACYDKALKIDAEYTKKLNPNDKQRLLRLLEVFEITGKSISYFQKLGNKKLFEREKFFHININPQRDILYQRCELRFKKMILENEGLQEIENFAKKYKNVIEQLENYSITKTIGLLDGVKYLNKEITLDEFLNNSIKFTRNYAKRQYTWFNHQFDMFDLRVE